MTVLVCCDAVRRFCKPCRLVTTLSKAPFKILTVDVQRQFTMSKRETRRMSREEKERLVGVPLRIMGTPHLHNMYFVAKDVCILIHTRKGNVAKGTPHSTTPVPHSTSRIAPPIPHLLTVCRGCAAVPLCLCCVHMQSITAHSSAAPPPVRQPAQRVDAGEASLLPLP